MGKYSKYKKKQIDCVICGKTIHVLDLGSYDAMDLGQNMWDGGTVDYIYMPYGSRLDGQKYAFGMCDDCVETKHKEGVIIKEEDYI